jgi:thioesterase domain-containing protein
LFVIHGYGGDVFCYTDFAHALAPDRPVYGLQAKGVDGSSERQQSVEEMAEHYAGLIDRHQPQGVVHLLGQSAGGWVVWAVAGVLLRRGRSIGMVAILDSGPTAAISPRLRASLLLRRTLRLSCRCMAASSAAASCPAPFWRFSGSGNRRWPPI